MKKYIGIWMDKRTAKIVTLINQESTLKEIVSEVEEYNPKGGSGTKFKGGPQDVVQDSKYSEREKLQLNRYFEKIVSELPDFIALIIFGPSDTGKKFGDFLSDKYPHISDKVVGIETADSMTDNQTVAWVKDYFK